MNEEYQKGQEIGELRADIKNLSSLLENHIKEQHQWNENIETEVNILKAWVQSTTGKIVVITAVASFVGWTLYQVIGWIITYKFK